MGRFECRGGALPRVAPSAKPDITTASGSGGWRRSERPDGGGAATTWTGSAGTRASLLGAGGRLTEGGESEDCSAPSRSVAQLDLAATSGFGPAPGATGTVGAETGAETGAESSASLGSSTIACVVISAWTARGAPSGADGDPAASFRMSSGTTGVGSGALSSMAGSGTNCAVFAPCADSHSAAAAASEASSSTGAGADGDAPPVAAGRTVVGRGALGPADSVADDRVGEGELCSTEPVAGGLGDAPRVPGA